MKEYITKILAFEKKYKLTPVREMLVFMTITLAVHYLYRFWSIHYGFRLFGIQIITPAVFDFFSDILFYPSQWVNKNIIGLQFITQGRDMFFYSDLSVETNKCIGWIGVNAGCSGLKQLIQFSILIMLYPGPWKHKLWFIPMGLLAIYLTNIIRIVGLSVIVTTWSNQDYFRFSHDWIFRPLFYVVIFGLWVFWVDKIQKKDDIKRNKLSNN